MRKKPSPTPSYMVRETPKSKKEIIGSILKKKTKEKFLSESQKEY